MVKHIVCKFCGGELLLLRQGAWQHVGTGCGREPEAITAAGYLLLDPNYGLQTQGNTFTTCERCQTTALIDASKPVPHGHPDGWVEGLYDPKLGRTHHWCCDTCAEHLL